MRATTALFVLAFIALAGLAMAQRQDEALDSLMLSSSLQPVSDPIPRLLQEALASTTATPGSYGGAAVTPGPIATSSTPAAQRSSSISAAAGAFSMLAAAAAAALML
jgi:hypothetical protein